MKVWEIVAAAAVVSNIFDFAEAYQGYVVQFPNGNQVPLLGHAGPAKTAGIDPFGRAWRAGGGKWTLELCLADSDNDGVSNGAELGDPECLSAKGGSAPTNLPIGNPGDPSVVPAAVGGNTGGTSGGTTGSTVPSSTPSANPGSQDTSSSGQDPLVIVLGVAGVGLVGLALFVKRRNAQATEKTAQVANMTSSYGNSAPSPYSSYYGQGGYSSQGGYASQSGYSGQSGYSSQGSGNGYYSQQQQTGYSQGGSGYGGYGGRS